MKYENITKAKFISRPNRFIAHVEVEGNELVVHVKNTGRCRELLIPGCTLFRDGVGYFPDAPTERGAKHLRELVAATSEGYHARIAFVIQGEGIREVRPYTETDPEFTKAFEEARAAGVEVVFYLCRVTADELTIVEEVCEN